MVFKQVIGILFFEIAILNYLVNISFLRKKNQNKINSDIVERKTFHEKSNHSLMGKKKTQSMGHLIFENSLLL